MSIFHPLLRFSSAFMDLWNLLPSSNLLNLPDLFVNFPLLAHDDGADAQALRDPLLFRKRETDTRYAVQLLAGGAGPEG
jgi:hypothetical protein